MTQVNLDAEIANEQAIKRVRTPILNEVRKAALALRFQGKTYKQIALDLKVKEQTVCKWFMTRGLLYDEYASYCKQLALSPKIPLAIHTESLNVSDRLKQVAPSALESIIDLSSSAKKEDVKLRASADLLDRAGYKPIERSINVNAIEELSEVNLSDLVSQLLGKHGLQLPQTNTVIEPLTKSINQVDNTIIAEVSGDSDTTKQQ